MSQQDKQPLSKEAVEEFVANDGAKCPYCQSGELEAGHGEFDGGGATCTVECLSCGRSWIECFTLTGLIEQ